MTEYEAIRISDEEKIKEMTIAGITITITWYGNAVRISTSQTLTAVQENQLKNMLQIRGFKIIWKDGVML